VTAVRTCRGSVPAIRLFIVVKARRQLESLLAVENRLLELIANGANLSGVLNDLCNTIDAHAPSAASMLCLMDMDGKQLSPGAGPRIPAALAAAITPWPIGPQRGSCGAAAFRKQRVITPDISNDPWIQVGFL
jgi:hypothetical protein